MQLEKAEPALAGLLQVFLVLAFSGCVGSEDQGAEPVLDVGGESSGGVDSEVIRGMANVPAGAFGRGCIPEQVETRDILGGTQTCKAMRWDYVLLDVPHRELTLSEFWIDQYEATREEWGACAQAGFCEVTSLFTEPSPEYPRHPASYLTWHEAKGYCEWRGKRLPTEAEWEKAARGTDDRIFPWGNEDPACDTANILFTKYTDVSTTEEGELCNSRTQEPVDAHPLDRSPYGVIGMQGNVQEWTADWADNDYYEEAPAVDPPGPAEASAGSRDYRIIRGAYYGAVSAFTFRRLWFDPTDAHTRIGVRCASSVHPETLDDPLAE
jgi:formylglycine-generating enzyme required for sulfatase activity